AKGDRHTFAPDGASSAEARAVCSCFSHDVLSCGIQMRNAKNDKIAQIPSDPCQPIPWKEANGTLNPDPKAPNMFIDTTYMPVMMPIFRGKFILINAGNNTLPIAIANPIRTVPVKREPTPKRDRIIMPIVRKHKAIKMVHSIPNRSEIFGTNGERKAKASKGSVVND